MPQPRQDKGCGVHPCPLPKTSPRGSGEQEQRWQLSVLAGPHCASAGDPGAAPVCHIIPRQVPRGLPALLGASTHTLPSDADSAPAAPSWGLHRKTCDATSAPESPRAVMETGSFPQGQQHPSPLLGHVC